MTGLDTNILLRVFAQDDPIQSARANEILSLCGPEDPGWISIACLLELVWVTVYTYKADRLQVCAMIDKLTSVPHLVLENSDAVSRASNFYQKGNADFADCLIAALGHFAGCSRTLTFDRKAAQTAGMTMA